MNNETVLSAAKQVRELIADAKNWTQQVGAKDKNGDFAFPTGEDAVCWCLTGAIEAALYKKGLYTYDNWCDIKPHFVTTLRQHWPEFGAGLVCFNDTPEREHADVLRLVDLTIDRLERLAA